MLVSRTHVYGWFVAVVLGFVLLVSTGLGAGCAVALELLGDARLRTSDALIDRHDHWRGGSYQAGLLLTPEDAASVLDMIELRFGVEPIAPWGLPNLAPDERPLAALMRMEVHGYFDAAPYEFAAGMGLAGIGPQSTGGPWGGADPVGEGGVSHATRTAQLGEALYPEIDLEIARRYQSSPAIALRPYARLRVGVEDTYFIGADILLGRAEQRAMRVRDHVTGHLLPRRQGLEHGTTVSFGSDLSYVANTAVLPTSRGVAPEDARWRLRSGVLWRSARFQMFYGATWLSRERASQPGSQVVGALHMSWNF